MGKDHIYKPLTSVIFLFMFVFVVVYVIYMKNGLDFQRRSPPNDNGTQGQELKTPEYIFFSSFFLIRSVRSQHMVTMTRKAPLEVIK